MSDKVLEALKDQLSGVEIGNPSDEATIMGPLASSVQADRFEAQLQKLEEVTDSVYQHQNGDLKDAYTEVRILQCHKPLEIDEVHSVEAFGPMTTLMSYKTIEEAIEIANKADGSLVGSLFTADDEIAKKITIGCAPYHGRFMVINRDSADESTGHGSPIASLVHGGPGRAGGGEELGGARAVLHHMQRVALQGSPTTLMNITGQHISGAETKEADTHPFKKYFEELEVGESLTTDQRTITNEDITEFANLTGDHFYAHSDDTSAKESLFGKRVAHGYLVLSITAGLFVHPDPGPVLLNYGLEDLRFTAPVAPGDTIQAILIVKRKTVRQQREEDEHPFGMVWWDVEVTNQKEKLVAEYTVLTLVRRKKQVDIDLRK